MAVVELPEVNLEMPDLSGVELPRIDVDAARETVGKAAANLGKVTSSATHRARSNLRDAMTDALPQRSAPSPLPFVLGGLLVGITIGYFLATSEFFSSRVRDAANQVRGRIDQARSSSGQGVMDDVSDRADATMDEFQREAEQTRSEAEQGTYAV